MKEILKVRVKAISVKRENNYIKLLENISIDLPTNKVFTIIGQNGSGKTTLLKTIAGLLDNNFHLDECDVLFEGKSIFRMDIEELLQLRKNKMKFILQDAIGSFDPLKRFDYYFSNFLSNKDRIDTLLNYFLLPESGKLFSLHPYEISGGMAQRISIILALIAEPLLLLLDEPTSSIDAPIANLLLNKIKEFVTSGNRSVLLVTQDILFAREISDCIAILKDGNLSAFQPPEEFFSVHKELLPEGYLING